MYMYIYTKYIHNVYVYIHKMYTMYMYIYTKYIFISRSLREREMERESLVV
jgi:hypothetical protein